MLTKSNDVLTWTISELTDAIKQKKISPVEVTRLLLNRIAKKDKELNSYITVMEDTSVNNAIDAEKSIYKGDDRGALHGIPIAVKDDVSIKGYIRTAGSELYKDFIPNEDAELIKKLKRSGAIIIGKTNMHELGYGTTGDISYYGPTRNPHNLTKITGGSSSGSGAAVAAHMAYGAIGSDTGGSVRVPSSFCGIVGIKPTFGSVSRHGTLSIDSTLNSIGPMTKSVLDNAMMLNVLVDFDAKDPYSVKRDSEDFTQDIGKPVKELSVGLFPPTDLIQPEVYASVDETVKDLTHYGVGVKTLQNSLFEDLLSAYRTIVFAEGYATLEDELIDKADKIGEFTRSRVMEGKEIYACDYLRAIKIKNQSIYALQDLFKEVDLILTPTVPILPTDINQREITVNGLRTEILQVLGRLTSPINVAGFPAISVPGIPKNGLPIGLQIIGPPCSERTLYRLASFIEEMYQ